MKKLKLDNPKALAAALVRRKWWMVFPTTALMLIFTFVAIVLPAIYVSETLILLDPRDVPKEMVLDLNSVDSDQRLSAIYQTVLSRTNLMRIYNDFADQLPDLQALSLDARILRLGQGIRVDLQRPDRRKPITHLRISYESRNPHLARAITSRLSSLFIEYDAKTRAAHVYGTAEFFKGEAQGVGRELDSAERRLAELKKRFQFELPEQLDANLRTLDRLQQQLKATNDSVDRYVSHRLSLQRQLSETPPVLRRETLDPRAPQSREVSPLVQEYRAKEKAYRDLAGRYTARHPDVLRAQGELDRLRDEIPPQDLLEIESEEPSAMSEAVAVNPLYQQIQAQLRTVETEMNIRERTRGEIEGAIGVYAARVNNTPRREQEISVLRREVDDLRLQHRELNEKLADAQLAGNLESRQKGEQFRVIDPASLPTLPAKPNRWLIILIGAVAAVAIGLALALGRDFIDQKFWTHEEVETFFGAPILTEIPRIMTPADEMRERRVAWGVSFGFAVFLLMGLSSLYWIYTTPEVRAWSGQHLYRITQLASNK